MGRRRSATVAPGVAGNRTGCWRRTSAWQWEAVRPTLFIHQRCARLLETLPMLQHDPNPPEDVLKVDADEEGVGGDDCADCLRYLVATKSRTVVERRLLGL